MGPGCTADPAPVSEDGTPPPSPPEQPPTPRLELVVIVARLERSITDLAYDASDRLDTASDDILGQHIRQLAQRIPGGKDRIPHSRGNGFEHLFGYGARSEFTFGPGFLSW